MNITALVYKTDLIFVRFDGQVIDRGDYIVAQTPQNPKFHWGNFILFPKAPCGEDLEKWPRIFREEFAAIPAVQHMSFGWDSGQPTAPVCDLFAKSGYQLYENIVLSAKSVHQPPKFNVSLEVRPFKSENEWATSIDYHVRSREPIYSLDGFAEFQQRQALRSQRMIAAGLGQWFGAFIDGRLAGDLGVFVEDGVGRFQNVVTHPDFRRQGICSTLVYHAARYAFERLGAHTLVMVADEHYHAAKIYESVGFKPTEEQRALSWWQRD